MPTVNRIYDCLDYRAYLRDFIEQRKRDNPAYSMRAFASRANINPGLFTRVLSGERNLAASHVLGLGKALRFTKKEQRFFELLVSYNQAKRQVERDYYFEQMHQFRKTNVKQVSVDQYALYSHWYYLAMRELLSIMPCTDGSEAACRKIAQTLEPAVSPAEVRAALETLKKLGVIARRTDGTLAPVESFTASGDEVPHVITNRFFFEFADLAKRAVDTQPHDERRLSTITFSASPEGYRRIKERIEEFRGELLTMVANDEGTLSRVYHVNFHLFPVTKTITESDA